MHLTAHHHGRLGALAPAALLLLALCLLAGGAQAADVPRYVVGDVLEIDFANQTTQIVIASVDTTSLAEPYYPRSRSSRTRDGGRSRATGTGIWSTTESSLVEQRAGAPRRPRRPGEGDHH